MAVEPPPPKRRPSGLRRVRDHRDLRPFINPQPVQGRVDSNGVAIPVRAIDRSRVIPVAEAHDALSAGYSR